MQSKTDSVYRNLQNKKVLIWGIGTRGGGISAANFLSKMGCEIFLIDSKNHKEFQKQYPKTPQSWQWFTGDYTHQIFKEIDIIIPSPAIPPHILEKTNKPMLSTEQIFFSLHKGKSLAITGTKGKTTTANLCAKMLNWQLGGNSNTPILDCDLNKNIVCELSSFQLHHLNNLPKKIDLSITTNIGVDHINWHETIKHYHDSKQKIVKESLGNINLKNIIATKENETISYKNEIICETKDIKLKGKHNEENILLAITAVKELGGKTESIKNACISLKPLNHRLEIIEKNSKLFINDSAGTTPQATLAAIETYYKDTVIILGGTSKGSDFTDLVNKIIEKNIYPILIGKTTETFSNLLGDYKHKKAKNIKEAMKKAIKTKRQTILLSPACASFGEFKDYTDRGNQFKEIIKNL